MFRAALRPVAVSEAYSMPLRGVQSPFVAFAGRFLGHSALRSASLFGNVTQPGEVSENAVQQSKAGPETSAIKPQDDTKLQEYYMEEARREQATSDKYVSALKRRVFELNVAQNGFFKNGQIVRDPDNGRSYKVTLTAEEIDLLEPTIYLQSYRIKSSMKKATVVNRFVRGATVKKAINQLHFNAKKMATELERFLKRGLEQAREAGYNENEMYIQALWTGSDGRWTKRPDIKGRGRTGIIEHPYIHLKAILKTEQTKRRIAWEKDEAWRRAKAKSFLNNEPLNFSVRGLYRW